MSADVATLERLEAGMRAAAAQRRTLVPAGSFAVCLSPYSSDTLLSLALPAPPDPADWDPSIAALSDAYRGHGARPRLEFFAELHPTLAAALERRGFVRDLVAPVMALAPGDLAAASGRPSGYRRLGPDTAGLRGFLQGQDEAFGGVGDEGALAWLPTLAAGLVDGTVLAAALEQEGYPVSGATVVTGGGVGELAGVWTHPERRRRGLAFTLCRQLLEEVFEAGFDLCWLSAAEDAMGVYRRLGFRRVGTQLNYSLAPADGA